MGFSANLVRYFISLFRFAHKGRGIRTYRFSLLPFAFLLGLFNFLSISRRPASQPCEEE